MEAMIAGMGFSWSCTDQKGVDLFEEFKINHQALGLADDLSPHNISEIRDAVYRNRYGGKFDEAARDAISEVQAMVAANLQPYETPKHQECPNCCCKPDPPRQMWGLDIEQCRRFLSIPLQRVWRASGGY